MFLTYKYFIKPNKIQRERIEDIFKKTKLIRTLYVEDMEHNQRNRMLLKEKLSIYKSKHPVLNDCDGSALMNELFKLQDLSDQNVLSKSVLRLNKHSYTTAFLKNGNSVAFVDKKHIYLPRVGNVKIIMHRDIPPYSRLKSCTITKYRDGKYFANISVEIFSNEVSNLNVENSIGLDYSSRYFIVDNYGNKYGIQKFYRDKEADISDIKKELAKLNKHSRDYGKTKLKLNKKYRKIVRQRSDYLHKLSSHLVKNYDVICIEDLDISNMSRKPLLTKSTSDNAFSSFVRMLDYKCEKDGKKLIKVDRYFASSKICSNCGSKNDAITINEKVWKCNECGEIHDRDINAAKNIRNKAIASLQSRRAYGVRQQGSYY